MFLCRSVFYLPKPRPLNFLVQDLFGKPTLVLQGAKASHALAIQFLLVVDPEVDCRQPLANAVAMQLMCVACLQLAAKMLLHIRSCTEFACSVA